MNFCGVENDGCLWISTEQNYQEVYQYFSEKLGKIKSKCRQRSNKNGAKYVLILMYSHNFNPSKFQKRPWRNWNIVNSIPPKTCLEELEHHKFNSSKNVLGGIGTP